MEPVRRVAQDTMIFPAFEAAGPGVLPVNAFFIDAPEPVLVDTGMPKDREAFFDALWSLTTPEKLKWVVLTHDDVDHAGNLKQVLDAAPDARVVTNFLSVPRLSAEFDIPLNRLHAVNSGQGFSTGEREFYVVRPPMYDSPTTLALFDGTSRVLFGSDSFGAFLPAAVENVDELDEAEFIGGLQTFATALSPWVHLVDQEKFEATLAEIARLQPETIVSGHGATMHGRTSSLLRALQSVPSLDPYVTPDAAAVAEILEQISHPAAA